MTQEPPETEGAGGATFVESGGFRIDRKRAVEKLSKFQLEDPHAYLLPWVRAAVAVSATRLRFSTGEDGLEMRFDGKPFQRQALEDPYGPLFQKEGTAGTGRRNLTLGLLACLRTSPESIEVLSGGGEERTLLSILTAESDTVGYSPGEDADTVIRVRRAGSFDRELDHVRAGCMLCPAEVFIEGEKVAPASPRDREPCLELEHGPLRGFLGVPESPGSGSLVDLHILGVRAQSAEMDLGAVPMRGWIDDDSLRLDASQSAVVQDARYSAAAERLSQHAGELVVLASRELHKRLPAVGRRLLADPGSLAAWREGLRASASSRSGGLGGAFLVQLKGLLSWGPRAEVRREDPLPWEIRAVKWLRAACAYALSDPRSGSRSGLGSALMEAPLWFSCTGEPLNLACLDATAGARGKVPYSRSPAPARAAPADTIWVLTDEDLSFLLSRYTLEDAT